ncbi:hypothetical protein AOR13_2698 [Alteromonas stellipolaris LMG 21856]|nr:hypothetical protein AOR13_2698 [Alteromonas stellipolaris LMG 21856]
MWALFLPMPPFSSMAFHCHYRKLAKIMNIHIIPLLANIASLGKRG